MLSATGIHKGFDGLGVLRGIDLNVEKGEVVALIGPSGSGKSTLLRCLNQLESVDSGTIVLDGLTLCRTLGGKLTYADPATLRRITLKMGMVFQSYNLFPHMSVMQNLTDAPMRVRRLSRAQATERARELLAKVGLSDKADQYPYQLSGGQQQRVAIARALCMDPEILCFDEPTSALDPELTQEVLGVMRDLVGDGNTVVVVDHDTRVLAEADYLVEMGPVAGAGGGNVIAVGTVDEVEQSQGSRIAPFLCTESKRMRPQVTDDEMFEQGHIRMATEAIHTVKPLEVDIPRGRLVAVTGVSGSGKTTLVLETLIPALKAQAAGERLPGHVRWVDAEGIARANLIDATPIGANVRSTVATYADIHDELRRAFACTPEAKAAGYKAGAFSYNTGALRCPTCDGTGSISLDVQFLPDVEIICPACRGSRYAEAASHIHREGRDGSLLTLPQLMDMSVDEAIDATLGLKKVQTRLQTLHDLGLGYLTLGEPTPALSGGEAQRLKLASEMGRVQDDAVFVFDEPTIGLHPLDVQVLLNVFDGLVAKGATVIVIEHDLDLIRNADYVIDMGPGGGDAGGQIVCAGTPSDIAACPASITGRYL